MNSAMTAPSASVCTRFLLALGLTAACAGTAFAGDCGALKQITSIDLIPTRSGLRMLPVTINGTPVKMMLSTAAGISALSESAVKELGLHAMDAERGRIIYRNGNASRLYVMVDHMEIGGVPGSRVPFMVSPGPKSETASASPVAGAFAGDLMDTFDVEMDFAKNKLNYFSTDHCDGKVVYWPTQAIAVVPYRSSAPGRSNPDSHLRVPMTLDGQALTAVIDTGSTRSTISAEVARDLLHITSTSPGVVPMGTVGNDPANQVFSYVFGSLTFDGIVINRPQIEIYPDLVGSKDPDNRFRTGSRTKRVDDLPGSIVVPEVTIGMNMLRKLHLYVATREHKLYITSADAPATTSP